MQQATRLYLSLPHMSGREQHYVQEVFDSNWIALLGLLVAAFEREFTAAFRAGSLVAKDVPDRSVAVGMPARVIRRKAIP